MSSPAQHPRGSPRTQGADALKVRVSARAPCGAAAAATAALAPAGEPQRLDKLCCRQLRSPVCVMAGRAGSRGAADWTEQPRAALHQTSVARRRALSGLLGTECAQRFDGPNERKRGQAKNAGSRGASPHAHARCPLTQSCCWRAHAQIQPQQTQGDRTMSAASSASTVTDADVGNIIKKMEDSNAMGFRRTTSVPALASRKSTVEMGLTPEQAAIIERMRAAQDSVGGFLDSSKKTMEATSSVLWDHFKKIPHDKLQSHIILRFNSYDIDHSGNLDRTEMREAMAEMGRRPTETELDLLMQTADQDGDGTINLEEFSLYIFQQIGERTPHKHDPRSSQLACPNTHRARV